MPTDMAGELDWLRALIGQVRDHAIFMIGPDGRNRTWSEGVSRVLGYAEAEFVGQHASELFTPEDRAAGVPERELAFAAEHGSASDERWLVRKDGARFWASGMTTRINDARGDLMAFAKIFRDLTVEKQFQDDLRGSEERYRLATGAAHEAIWDRDLNTSTMTWSDNFEQLFGYPPEEVGLDVAWWEERIHPEDRARVIHSLREAVANGASRWDADYRLRHRSGRYALVEDQAYIMRSTDGTPLRMLGAMAEVTERRRAEEGRRHAQRLEALGRLAGGVAHELNNMLTAIIGNTAYLDKSLSAGDERREFTRSVLKSAERSAKLTRQLLAFAQRQMTQPVQLDLNTLVREMEPILQPLLGHRIALDLRLAPQIGAVLADRTHVEQVVVNLLLNARDAMPVGGRVTLETQPVHFDGSASDGSSSLIEPGNYVLLAVSDTGTGMDAGTLERAFEPFFTTKPFGEGTGLGLAAVYGAVKQQGGYVWAYSEPGCGTVIKVYFRQAAT
ncbi:MAG: PAS domain S-box protein [Gemmatimonadales bacterium]|nr:PAS domain S-box protein [Gemmatimonadales bacterium]MBA3553642.1 PAS domain S-box protein [Gemmatimonadales bacterium]